MKKSECKDSLEMYKKFLTRVTKISEFMKTAEAPTSILESLETHMNSLEGKKGSPTKGSPTNNVSPTSTPAKSGGAVPTLEPPPTEAAVEPVTDSLLDLDPLSSSGPPAGGASAAPTSWGDPFAPASGHSPVNPELDLFSMQPVEVMASGFSPLVPPVVQSPLATCSTISAPPVPCAPTAAPVAPTLDLFSESTGVADCQSAITEAPVTAAASATPAAPAITSALPATSAGGDLMGAFGGLGDMLMPAMSAPAASPVKPMGGDLDSTMASLAGNLGMGSQKPGETAGGANWQAQVAAPSWGMTMVNVVVSYSSEAWCGAWNSMASSGMA
ncbi:hypothetical protein P4O66_002576 [Electrophorus voltai]|uniref:Uncharacterized protein n=1 Tax=Electrophorus voltai TaxID=2609070 RepID=A0AAD8YZX0_9TELE|nr:hypothetical protein P4O66_002576 [Electrophorus voltai]